MAGFFDVMGEPPVPLGQEYPLFNRISIETSKHCNRECGFCPCHKGTRHDRDYLPDELISKVLDELAALEFDGVVQTFLLNEPLLDPRMTSILCEVSTRLPRASTYMSTNGDPLGRDPQRAYDKLCALFAAGLTVVNLNVYDVGDAGKERAALYAEVTEALVEHGVAEATEHRYRRHNPRRSYFAVTDMRTDRGDALATDMFYDRTSEDRDPGPGPAKYCMRTQRHMVVEHTGEVIICCAVDPTDAKMPRVGNVRDRTIRELWDDELYFKYRYMTQQARRELYACRGCTHTMAYPHVVRKVTADEGRIAEWEREAAGSTLSLPVVQP